MSAQAARNDNAASHLLVEHARAIKAGDYPGARLVLDKLIVQTCETDAASTWPAVDIFAPLEAIDYVIQGVDLCEGAPALVAGYGFSGKTVALQSAAVTIASGIGKVWDVFSAPRGRVLHLDYEQGSRLTRERYQRLAAALMLTPDEVAPNLTLVCMPGLYLDDSKAEAEICRLTEGHRLCIIDSLRAAAPSLDENSSDVRRVLDMLSRVSEKTGCAFVVIHHARKPQKDSAGGARMAIRGSGALYDACATVLVFEGEKDQPTRVIHEKARVSGKLADDFLLTISDVDADGVARGGLVVTAEGAPSRGDQAWKDDKVRRLARTEQLTSELRELFKAEPVQGGAASIATKLGRSAPDIRGVLALLVEAGTVEESGTTKDKRHTWADRESRSD
jgi:hypothetical protein